MPVGLDFLVGPGSSGSDLKNRTIPSNSVVDPDLDPESKSGRISNFLRWSDPEPTYFKTFTFYAILMNTGRWSMGHYLHKHYLIYKSSRALIRNGLKSRIIGLPNLQYPKWQTNNLIDDRNFVCFLYSRKFCGNYWKQFPKSRSPFC